MASLLWRQLVEDKQRQARQEIEAIVQGYHPERIFLFGSMARGDVHRGSDVDLLIIKEEAGAERFLDRIQAVLECCSGQIGVEPLVYTSQELADMLQRGNDFIHSVLREGLLVYDRAQSGGSGPLAGTGAL